jgi:peptidoglycan hydrolase CwlO-like protein
MSTELDARIAELSQEIRRYPTPIARCDEQLSGLLEQRARLLAERERSAQREAETGCSPETTWINDGGINAA